MKKIGMALIFLFGLSVVGCDFEQVGQSVAQTKLILKDGRKLRKKIASYVVISYKRVSNKKGGGLWIVR